MDDVLIIGCTLWWKLYSNSVPQLSTCYLDQSWPFVCAHVSCTSCLDDEREYFISPKASHRFHKASWMPGHPPTGASEHKTIATLSWTNHCRTWNKYFIAARDRSKRNIWSIQLSKAKFCHPHSNILWVFFVCVCFDLFGTLLCDKLWHLVYLLILIYSEEDRKEQSQWFFCHFHRESEPGLPRKSIENK